MRNRLSHHAGQLVELPLWALFTYFVIAFGLIVWLIGNFIIGEPVSWWMAAIEAVVFGLIMTWFTQRTRRRMNDSFGADLNREQRMELATALWTTKLPQDPVLREALPRHIDRLTVQNRRIRIIGPVEFILFAGLACYLAIRGDMPVWYAFTGLFVGFAVLCYLQPTATLKRLKALRHKARRAGAKAD